MEAPRSKLERYLSKDYGQKVKKDFSRHLILIRENSSDSEKANTFYSTKNRWHVTGLNLPVSINSVKTDFSKDNKGNQITEGHHLYGLSKIITDFQKGQKFRGEISGNQYEGFFESKGKDFCAGYLSKFGYFHRVNSISEGFLRTVKKLFNYEKYSAARNVYNKLRRE